MVGLKVMTDPSCIADSICFNNVYGSLRYYEQVSDQIKHTNIYIFYIQTYKHIFDLDHMSNHQVEEDNKLVNDTGGL